MIDFLPLNRPVLVDTKEEREEREGDGGEVRGGKGCLEKFRKGNEVLGRKQKFELDVERFDLHFKIGPQSIDDLIIWNQIELILLTAVRF